MDSDELKSKILELRKEYYKYLDEAGITKQLLEKNQ
jgi:hypothetical protein